MTDHLSNRFYSSDGWDTFSIDSAELIMGHLRVAESKMVELVREIAETEEEADEAAQAVKDALHDYLWGDAVSQVRLDLEEAEQYRGDY